MKLTKYEKDYVKLVDKINFTGIPSESRSGGIKSIFGTSLEIDLKKFPILRGRKIFYKGVLGELAAMLKKPRHVQDFKKFGCNYWDNFANEHGELSLDYGNAWLDWNGVNQLECLIKSLRDNPNSRRHIVSGWRPDKLEKLTLPCCHLLYQWNVRNNYYLDMLCFQRSVDVMVGLPSDIIFCAVWTILICNQLGYKPGNLIMSLGNTHIYDNHSKGVTEYLHRINTVNKVKNVPHYTIGPAASIFNFHPDMFKLTDYKPLTPIKFEVNL